MFLYHHGIVLLCLSFRVFAPRCAACQKPIAPEPVSAVIAIQWERVGRGRGAELEEGVHVEGEGRREREGERRARNKIEG